MTSHKSIKPLHYIQAVSAPLLNVKELAILNRVGNISMDPTFLSVMEEFGVRPDVFPRLRYPCHNIIGMRGYQSTSKVIIQFTKDQCDTKGYMPLYLMDSIFLVFLHENDLFNEDLLVRFDHLCIYLLQKTYGKKHKALMRQVKQVTPFMKREWIIFMKTRAKTFLKSIENHIRYQILSEEIQTEYNQRLLEFKQSLSNDQNNKIYFPRIRTIQKRYKRIQNIHQINFADSYTQDEYLQFVQWLNELIKQPPSFYQSYPLTLDGGPVRNPLAPKTLFKCMRRCMKHKGDHATITDVMALMFDTVIENGFQN